MKRVLKWFGAVLGVLVIAIQLVPVERSNPPVETEVAAPAEVRAVLRRACYDCHSNETDWPWYAWVAPISWQVAHDVHEGREKFNFSTWNRLEPRKQAKVQHEVWEEVSEGEMPPWFYLPVHPEARLSAEDRSVLQAWSAAAERRGRQREGHDDD